MRDHPPLIYHIHNIQKRVNKVGTGFFHGFFFLRSNNLLLDFIIILVLSSVHLFHIIYILYISTVFSSLTVKIYDGIAICFTSELLVTLYSSLFCEK